MKLVVGYACVVLAYVFGFGLVLAWIRSANGVLTPKAGLANTDNPSLPNASPSLATLTVIPSPL